MIYLQKISDFKTSEIIQEEKPVKTTQGKLYPTSCWKNRSKSQVKLLP
jgi:hypothetical protein